MSGPGASQPYSHEPVMLGLVVELFGPVPAGPVIDATVGGGGHAAALLEAHAHLSLIGLDRDPDAVLAAGRRLAPFGERAVVRPGRFDRLADALRDAAHAAASGVLFDLGVSSAQLDRAERGFSFRHEGPLDMRMDPTQATSASEIVNETSADELARMIRRFGDERFAGRIARAIVAAREGGARSIQTTGELAEIVRAAVPSPARRRGGHPARRTFQALRIAVNEELAILPGALDQAIDVLVAGGRCVALAYHSGEDRIVKERFRHAATGGWNGPPGLPPPPDVHPTVSLLRRGVWRPSAAEVAANPRAGAARLRAVQKLGSQRYSTAGESGRLAS